MAAMKDPAVAAEVPKEVGSPGTLVEADRRMRALEDKLAMLEATLQDENDTDGGL